MPWHLPPTDPSTWPTLPMPTDRSTGGNGPSDADAPPVLPTLPDGQDMTLHDWIARLDQPWPESTATVPDLLAALRHESPRQAQRRAYPDDTDASYHALNADQRLWGLLRVAPINVFAVGALLEPSVDGLRAIQADGDPANESCCCSANGLYSAMMTTLRQDLTIVEPSATEQALLAQELTVAMLIAAGAPLDANAVRLAWSRDNPRLVLRLLRAWPHDMVPDVFLLQTGNGYPSSLLNELIVEQHTDRPVLLDALLTAGHPLDFGTKSPSMNVLSTAVLHNDLVSVAQLVQAGVDVNGASGNGDTPMYHALSSSPEMVDLLLDAGANPRNIGHMKSPAEVVVWQNSAPVAMLQRFVERDAVRPNTDHGPLLPAEDEQHVLKVLNDWAQKTGLTENQRACKNWLEARALLREIAATDTPSSTPRSRL